MPMTEEKKIRKTFRSDAKRARNPNDITSTIKMPSELRAKVAAFCEEENISMNKLITDFLKKVVERTT
jgi:predicted HicB family RNase H-like nuclease